MTNAKQQKQIRKNFKTIIYNPQFHFYHILNTFFISKNKYSHSKVTQKLGLCSKETCVCTSVECLCEKS